MAHLGSTRYDSAARQLRRTAGRTAAGARAALGVVLAVAAALGAVPPVSLAWLVPALAAELPSLSESLAAVKAARAASEKRS